LLVVLGGALALFAFSRTQRGQGVAADLVEYMSTWTPSQRAEIYRPLFDAATARYQLPPNLLMRIADRESNFNPNARSSRGAVGIMQIVPRWHPEVGESGALDPSRAIPYAAKILSAWRRQYGSWTLALAAYNAGPSYVDQYQGVPPFPETRKYIAAILPSVGIIETGIRYA
jgi:soluble lytic murein transglycosylase-like protein